MSLFANLTRSNMGPGRVYLAERKRRALRVDIATFADAIADGASLAAAGRAIGVNHQRASVLFRRMRDDLGWQAQ